MLRILGWAGYDTGLRRAFDSFTRDTGIAVSFKGVRNQDEMHHVAQTEAFDIACPTTDRLASWLDSRLIAPLDEDRIGFARIDPAFHADAHTVIQGSRYGSPNIWGSGADECLPNPCEAAPRHPATPCDTLRHPATHEEARLSDDHEGAVLRLHTVMPAGESVNISTDNQISISQLIPLICAHYGYSGEILRKPARHSDVLSHNASNEKVKGLIQYSLTPFDKGLTDTLAWYTAQIGVRA